MYYDVLDAIGIIAIALVVFILIGGIAYIIVVPPSMTSNMDMTNVNTLYTKAYITIGSEYIEVDVDTWNSLDDGKIKIKSKDGKQYLTSIYNTVLFNK
ncbi:MAG: hypothetical protein ACI4PE_03390 [Bacilli bacterium]